MFNRQFKNIYYAVEALGSLGTGYYCSYIFFLLRDRYGFGNAGNLSVAALQGLVFAVAAWQGGKFAQRRGYFTAVRLGFAGMIAGLLAGSLLSSLAAQLLVLVFVTASMCLIWPAMEALVSEGENAQSLPGRVGIYNATWATCSAFSYFAGGAIFDRLGAQSLYYVPMAIFGAAMILVEIAARNPKAAQEAQPQAVSVQLESQPSPSMGLPSSQASPGCLMPLPHKMVAHSDGPPMQV